MKSFKGKTVLVTGAGGSIGSQLCKQLVEKNAKLVKAFDISEYNLHKLGQDIGNEKESIHVWLL